MQAKAKSPSVLLDSSTWISFFINDIHSSKAKILVNNILLKEIKVLLPVIISAEVINNLYKIDQTGFISKQAKLFFAKGNIKHTNLSKFFWYKSVEKYSQKVKLKTLDLIILTFAFENKVKKLYSFDKKLIKAYNQLKNEINSKKEK